MDAIKDAKELRLRGEYEQALALYQEIWKTAPDSRIAAAIINCYRSMARFDDAESFYALAKNLPAESPWLTAEYVWLIYEKYIKPVHIDDKALFMQKANEIMSLAGDLLPRKLTAFKVTDILAREPSPDWGLVRSWLESIREVETESIDTEPEKKLSDKRKWYFKYTKTLAKLGEFELCRTYCRTAIALFKNAYLFKHRAAKCAQALKDFSTAKKEYASVLSVHDEWYIHLDMADLCLETKEYKQAEMHVIIAIQKCSAMQLKARAYFLWAQILAAIANPAAAIPLLLFTTFRKSRNWPIPAQAQELEQTLRSSASLPSLTLESLIQKSQQLAVERSKGTIPRLNGVIKNARERFGFIKVEDGRDIFFSYEEYSGPPPRLGLAVTFQVKEAFDRKKNRKSLEAVGVAAAAPRLPFRSRR